MNLSSIKQKVSTLFESTPDDVHVGFGYRIKDGKLTNEIGFTYLVPKKRQIHELSENEIFPTTITHDGIEYKTDVVEVPQINLFGTYCYGTGTNEPPSGCFDFINPTTPPANRNYTRPIKGGVGIFPTTSVNAGTLGFVAVDIATQALVGVTNNHVAISSSNDAFFTGERNLNSVAIFNESFPMNEIQNPATCDSGPFIPAYKIGRTLRYQPLVRPINGSNLVDGALISLNQTDAAGQPIIDINESWKQVGLPQITTPPPFATLAELNSMIFGGTAPTNIPFTNTEIISAGRTTGPKGGSCSLRLHLLTCTINVTGNSIQGTPTTVSFTDQMSVVRVNSDNDLCILPAFGGDSGSGAFAQFGGVWKIIGLLFAGGVNDPNTGGNPILPGDPLSPTASMTQSCAGSSFAAGVSYFTFLNKITNVETALGIEAWDGTVKPFVDPNSIEYVSVCGGNFTKTLTCSGDTYWQVGLTNSLISPCNP